MTEFARVRAFVSALALALALGCDRSSTSLVQEAEFGVFFGGQVQELQELAKELDPSRQQHGFRLTFRAPLARDLVVKWELSLPASDQAGPRAALVGQAQAKAGQRMLEVPLAFRSSDPLGAWHARVTAGDQVVIDRDFTLVAPPPAPAARPVGPRGLDSAGPRSSP